MNKIMIIAKKELAVFFKSPIAYIILILTTAIFNVFFVMSIDGKGEASLRDVFKVMEFMFVFIIPLLTMRVFSEEKLTGTMEFLMSTPTTNTAIVLGKYLGSLIFSTLMIAVTAIYYVIIEYGVESCYNETLKRINRGHTFEDSVSAIERTAERGIRQGAHFIIGLPGEDRSAILGEMRLISKLPINQIKFHQLQIVRNTIMETEYLRNPDDFSLYTASEYLTFIVEIINGNFLF